MRNALLSVYDKTGLVPFAQALLEMDFRLLSTGGTARSLREAGLPVTDVSELTGFPEMLDGRVKTLHPRVHGGILARREIPGDLETLRRHEMELIDLVCVNLYPFEEVLRQGGRSEAEMIELIDIGGPSMLRAAAKNFSSVTVVCQAKAYPQALEALRAEAAGKKEEALCLRRQLAGQVFVHTAHYDSVIRNWFAGEDNEELDLHFIKQQDLRYGENPHQTAAFYRAEEVSDWSLASAEQLHGKELSYNNIQDANAALDLLREFDRPCVVALKHMNPCGLATDEDITRAWQKAYAADPVSIFGGIVASNRPVTLPMAEEMHKIFLEIIVAPAFEPEALALLEKKKNLRLLRLPMTEAEPRNRKRYVSVSDGLLVQDLDCKKVRREDCTAMTRMQPKEEDWQDLLEAFSVVKHCKSNAIVLYKEGRTLGIGVGQSNRVGAARLAIEQAGEEAKGAVLASDAFFPMPDTLEAAIAAGVRAVIQPGGSIRDQDSVAVCEAAGVPMVATGIRHFKH